MSGMDNALHRSPPHRNGAIGFRVWRGHARLMPDAHVHGDVECNFVLRGAMRYFLGGRFQTVAAGVFSLFWAGIPHRLMEIEQPTEVIWVTLPLAWALDWELGTAFGRRLLRGELIAESDASRAESDGALLQSWVHDASAASLTTRRLTLLELQARLGRLAQSATGVADEKSVSDGDPVERMADYIGRHFRLSLSVAKIASAAGLHPHYAMGLFKRGCGMSVWEYVTRLRVSHAQRMLLTTADKLDAIARASGFASSSSFYEAFMRYGGSTPRQYRLAMRP